jgi:hypothetical protein
MFVESSLRLLSEESFTRLEGIDPVSLVFFNERSVSLVRPPSPISEGMEPVREFEARLRSDRAVRDDNVIGMEPKRRFV